MEGNMARKILYGSLIGLSVILTVLSLVGIGAAWAYNEPLTRLGLARLNEIDQELGQAQTTLRSAELELERAVRILEDVEIALAALTQKTTQASDTLHAFGETLDDTLIPGLRTASEKIDRCGSLCRSCDAGDDQHRSFLNLESAGTPRRPDRRCRPIDATSPASAGRRSGLHLPIGYQYVSRGRGKTQRHVELLGVVSMYESGSTDGGRGWRLALPDGWTGRASA
jgi:hypothetical protein